MGYYCQFVSRRIELWLRRLPRFMVDMFGPYGSPGIILNWQSFPRDPGDRIPSVVIVYCFFGHYIKKSNPCFFFVYLSHFWIHLFNYPYNYFIDYLWKKNISNGVVVCYLHTLSMTLEVKRAVALVKYRMINSRKQLEKFLSQQVGKNLPFFTKKSSIKTVINQARFW